MDVRERLRQLMNERDWSVYKLAKEADIPLSTIRNMFQRNTDPSIFTLECICKSMGMTMAQFFDAENKMGLNDEQIELLQHWNMLSEHDKQLVIELTKSLKKQF